MAKEPFLSPVGRIVAGDPFKASTTDINGNPRTIKAGPNAGQATQEYFINLAVNKSDPELLPFLTKIYQQARANWPQFFAGAPGWPDNGPSCTNPNMSLKWQDGDGVDGMGQPNSTKEGYSGCIVFRFASAYPPKVFYKDHYAPHEEIKDSNLVRTGDFVRIGGMMDTNGFPTKPGMKLYLGQVALWGKGVEIVSGPNAAQVFGAAAGGFQAPGMTALPAGGMPAAMPLAMAAPAAAPLALPGAPGAMPAPVLVQPNPGFAAGPAAMTGLAPLAPVAALQPLAPPAPQLTPAALAAGHTWASIQGQGTPDQLRAAGYIV